MFECASSRSIHFLPFSVNIRIFWLEKYVHHYRTKWRFSHIFNYRIWYYECAWTYQISSFRLQMCSHHQINSIVIVCSACDACNFVSTEEHMTSLQDDWLFLWIRCDMMQPQRTSFRTDSKTSIKINFVFQLKINCHVWNNHIKYGMKIKTDCNIFKRFDHVLCKFHAQTLVCLEVFEANIH